ncbi:DMT family transporter [Neisseria weixii]|uniref:DMT family transporter n=1 Tax=Neisseria weixii TaxID=1853276 RepID=A0A3N4MTC8_9NEIS|nr:DMT family transporter [Neisseria weixii]RPD86961.1 DMT family transporter [Neisseria weixii]RPD87639.1 DMT family transporter [Neisseria weixii]
MHYLVASILCSVLVSVLLKVARKQKIKIEQAVAVNYIVAITLTMVVLKPDLSNPVGFLPTWWLFAALGVLLPSVFVIMGKAVESVGIVKSDAAQRLSLFLPIVASFAIFGEQLTEGRLIGIALAFVALFCLLWKADGSKKSGGITTQIALLMGVWAGYGVIDVLFKQVAKSGTAFAGNLLVAFCLAAIVMFSYLFSKGTKWTKEGIIGGVLLGGLNFLNIVTYISAHQAISDNPTLVFAGINMGVIVLGTLVGAWIFKEKISSINAAGISVALVAIGCLFYWEQIRRFVGM